MAIDEALSGAETEAMLLQLTRDVTPAVRGAAVSALGECPPPALWKVIWRDWNTWKQIVVQCFAKYQVLRKSTWIGCIMVYLDQAGWSCLIHWCRNLRGNHFHIHFSTGKVLVMLITHPVGRTGSTRIYKSMDSTNYLWRQLHFWKMKFPNGQSRFGSGSMWVITKLDHQILSMFSLGKSMDLASLTAGQWTLLGCGGASALALLRSSREAGQPVKGRCKSTTYGTSSIIDQHHAAYDAHDPWDPDHSC